MSVMGRKNQGMRTCLRATLLALAIPLGPARASPTPGDDPFILTIKPLVGADGNVAEMDVLEKLIDGTVNGEPPLFKAVLSVVTTTHIADSISELKFTDAVGSVPFLVSDEASEETLFRQRRWRLTRAVHYPLAVHYRIPVRNGPARGGPPFGLVSAGGGVAGSGYAFLMLPDHSSANQTRVVWDLSDLPPGSIGAFTSGEGDTVIRKPPEAMNAQWMMAGPAERISAAERVGFHSYILGRPPIASAELARFAQRTYDTLADRLPASGHPDYRLMVRVRDGRSFTTGTATIDGSAGALVTTGTEYYAGQDAADLLNTVFREMTHFWVGQLSNRSNWFSEGLTVYLSATLPCEARLMTPQVCVSKLNQFLHDYNGSVGHDWSQAQIEASGFSSEAVRLVPYARGALFFAELDSRIKARSKSRRTLLDALRPYMMAREEGHPFTLARFEGMLRHELGSSAVADFRAKLIDGKTPIRPPSDAFGPCLEVATERFTDGKTGIQHEGLVWRPIAIAPPRVCAAT